MGGFGSGRNSGKRTTGDMWPLDIRKIARAGLLKPGKSFNWQWSINGKKTAFINISTHNDMMTLDYRVRDRGGEWQAMNYPVHLSWTPCTYGGERAWWLCPAAGCGRRVAVLYGGKVYACRHCHQLDYPSQRTAPGDKPFERADKIRERLGWGGGIASPQGNKPKGMHWKTYLRLLGQLNGHSNAAIQNTSIQVARIKARMG